MKLAKNINVLWAEELSFAFETSRELLKSVGKLLILTMRAGYSFIKKLFLAQNSAVMSDQRVEYYRAEKEIL